MAKIRIGPFNTAGNTVVFTGVLPIAVHLFKLGFYADPANTGPVRVTFDFSVNKLPNKWSGWLNPGGYYYLDFGVAGLTAAVGDSVVLNLDVAQNIYLDIDAT